MRLDAGEQWWSISSEFAYNPWWQNEQLISTFHTFNVFPYPARKPTTSTAQITASWRCRRGKGTGGWGPSQRTSEHWACSSVLSSKARKFESLIPIPAESLNSQTKWDEHPRSRTPKWILSAVLGTNHINLRWGDKKWTPRKGVPDPNSKPHNLQS